MENNCAEENVQASDTTGERYRPQQRQRGLETSALWPMPYLSVEEVVDYFSNHSAFDPVIFTWMGEQTISICNQPPRPAQPGHPCVGRRNE